MSTFRAFLFAGIAVSCLATDVFAQAPGERVEFPNDRDGPTVMIPGNLLLPDVQKDKYAVVVIMSSSGGLVQRDWEMARIVNRAGAAAFVIDSFGARGIGMTINNKRKFTENEMASDAAVAIRWLQNQPRIDRSRIGVLGRSLGASTAMLMSTVPFRTAFKIGSQPPKLAIAIYPACMTHWKDPKMVPGGHIEMFLGEEDDVTPPKWCLELGEKMKAQGGSVNSIVYPRANHGFDEDPYARKGVNAMAENYGNCRYDQLDRGVAVRADNGGALNVKETWDAFFASCVTRGARYGGDQNATTAMDKQIVEVVKARLVQ